MSLSNTSLPNVSLPTPSDEAVAALAPTGTLRAAINLSNFLLVTGKSDAGDPQGVSPDMALALANQLGVPLELKKLLKRTGPSSGFAISRAIDNKVTSLASIRNQGSSKTA